MPPIYEQDGKQVMGSVAPGYVALGRTHYSLLNTKVGPISSSALDKLSQAHIVAPTASPVATQKSANPVSAAAPGSGGIPTPVLVGAGVVGLLAVALVAMKLKKKS